MHELGTLTPRGFRVAIGLVLIGFSPQLFIEVISGGGGYISWLLGTIFGVGIGALISGRWRYVTTDNEVKA